MGPPCRRENRVPDVAGNQLLTANVGHAQHLRSRYVLREASSSTDAARADAQPTISHTPPMTVAVTRVSDEPVVAAGAVPGYGPIFNAGVIHHDGRFHLFARGVRDGYRRNRRAFGPRFLDYVSDVLVFTSLDGRAYTFQQVLAESSPDRRLLLRGPARAARPSGGDEHVVMTLHEPARRRSRASRGASVCTASATRTAGSSSTATSGPSSGRPACRTRTLSSSTSVDGRVALIHRVHPDMQIALFDSLDDLWDPRARLLGRPPARPRAAHHHLALTGRARRRSRRSPGADRRRARALLPRARCNLPLHASRWRSSTGRPATSRPRCRIRSCGPSSTGSATAMSTTSSSCRALSHVPTARLPHLRRGRPKRRSSRRRRGRDRRGPARRGRVAPGAG